MRSIVIKRHIGQAKGSFGRTIDDVLGSGFFNSFDSNVMELPDSYSIQVAVPGFRMKDIEMYIGDRVLIIKCDRTKGVGSVMRSEFETEHFQRSFVLPGNADADRISARCKRGLLTIRIPKKPGTALRKIPVRSADEGFLNRIGSKFRRAWKSFVESIKRLTYKTHRS